MGVSCYILDTCWVGQEVRLGFPVTFDEKDGLRVASLIFTYLRTQFCHREALLTGGVLTSRSLACVGTPLAALGVTAAFCSPQVTSAN